MLKELKKDHHITYLTLDDGSAEPSHYDRSSEYANDVITVAHRSATKFSVKFYSELIRNLVSDMPYALQKYVSAEMREKISFLTANHKFDILVCDFLAPAVNLPAAVNLPTLLFQHNVEAMIWRRHFEVAENIFRKLYFRFQWKRMVAHERSICKRFDSVVAVSEQDAEIMKDAYDVRSISQVGTGVDTGYFFEAQGEVSRGPEIVFTGSMDWLPNDDAIRWFLQEVFPHIQEKLPDASLSVVGRNPPQSLIEYCHRRRGVTVTGSVPDVRPYLRAARCYVVPIRIGGGTRLKIYEAMAMSLPVVSTSVGAEGLPVNDGEGIFIRDNPGDFAEAVIELLSNPAMARDQGQTGASIVRNRFSWDRITADFDAACVAAVSEHAE